MTNDRMRREENKYLFFKFSRFQTGFKKGLKNLNIEDSLERGIIG